MVRPRLKDKDLPLRMRRKGKRFYYRHRDGREIPLGKDLAEARRKWAELENLQLTCASLFGVVADRWELEQVPLRAKRTQHDYKRHVAMLRKVFAAVPMESIAAHHVRRYYDLRMAKSLHQANREKKVLSMIFNWAAGAGIVNCPNPCAAVRGKKEAPREVYVDDAAFQAVWDKAEAGVRDAMDLARLTSQRPADVLKMARTDLREGCLEVRQGKTGRKLRIEVVGELQSVIERILARAAGKAVASLSLVQDDAGQPYTYWTFAKRFQAARDAAGEKWQFRDLRAKAATELDDQEGPRAAQKLLGHASVTTTEGYIRNRRGARVKPLR